MNNTSSDSPEASSPTRATVLNALTVDVEEHFQVSAFEGTVDRKDWDSIPSRVVDNTGRILDLFDSLDVKATFFVLGWVAARYPELVREIADRGHEVGSHGWSHRLVYQQTRNEFRAELKKSKQTLEDAAGCAVVGYRAASFSISRETMWAFDELIDAGFLYDSSLFPVRHDRYGIPGAPRGIYRMNTDAGSIYEVPPSTFALGRIILPVAGGGYLRIYPLWLTDWAIRRLNRDEKRPAVVYVHPWEVDPGQPRIDAPWTSRFRHYSRLDTTADKLRRLAADHEFGPIRRVLAQAPDVPLREVS